VSRCGSSKPDRCRHLPPAPIGLALQASKVDRRDLRMLRNGPVRESEKAAFSFKMMEATTGFEPVMGFCSSTRFRFHRALQGA